MHFVPAVDDMPNIFCQNTVICFLVYIKMHKIIKHSENYTAPRDYPFPLLPPPLDRIVLLAHLFWKCISTTTLIKKITDYSLRHLPACITSFEFWRVRSKFYWYRGLSVSETCHNLCLPFQWKNCKKCKWIWLHKYVELEMDS